MLAIIIVLAALVVLGLGIAIGLWLGYVRGYEDGSNQGRA